MACGSRHNTTIRSYTNCYATRRSAYLVGVSHANKIEGSMYHKSVDDAEYCQNEIMLSPADATVLGRLQTTCVVEINQPTCFQRPAAGTCQTQLAAFDRCQCRLTIQRQVTHRRLGMLTSSSAPAATASAVAAAVAACVVCVKRLVLTRSQPLSFRAPRRRQYDVGLVK